MPGAITMACLHLAALGCPEGVSGKCVGVLTTAQAAGLMDLRLPCLQAATSPAAAAACGIVLCQVPASAAKAK
jgi:hypothetical protein